MGLPYLPVVADVLGRLGPDRQLWAPVASKRILLGHLIALALRPFPVLLSVEFQVVLLVHHIVLVSHKLRKSLMLDLL